MDVVSGVIKTVGGVAQHVQEGIGELGPAAAAQRREFRKSRDRLNRGQHGFSDAQRQGMQAEGNTAIANQQAGQQADIARAQAAGQLSGGAATEAQRVAAQQAAAAVAQNAGNVQQQSNAFAQQQHAADQQRVDAQRARFREFAQRQGQISKTTTEQVGDSFSMRPGGATQPTSPKPDPVYDANSAAKSAANANRAKV